MTERAIEGPPTLVVEVLSPSTTTIDRTRKRELYARHGIPYYWIVDPVTGALEAYGLTEGCYTLLVCASGAEPISLPPFPGLAFAPASLRP